jgi:hypothetical protein
MSLPRISVIVPTVAGREDHLDRCVFSYNLHAAGQYELELVVENDRATCGLGWQLGVDRATGDYLHFTCDDIEPRPGWAVPAIEAIEAGFIPAPQVYGADGVPQSHPVWGQLSPDWTPVYMTSLPFVSREQYEAVQPLLTTHYFSDDWVSFRCEQRWPTRLRIGYAFTHHWAQHKRGAGMSEWDRMAHDEPLYQQARRMSEAGEWTEPWPLSRP